MERSMRSNPKLQGLLILIAIGAMAWFPLRWVFEHVSVSPTHSDPHHFFWFSKKPKDLAAMGKGDYVIFPHCSRIIDNCYPSCKLIKKVVCVPGDTLSAHNRTFSCNDKFLGTSLTHNKRKVSVASFEFQGIIPEGKLFVMCSARDSYDSRYIGFVDKKDVQAIAHPLF